MSRCVLAAIAIGLLPTVAWRSRSTSSSCSPPTPRARSTTARSSLQRQGYAAALSSREIQDAIRVGYLGRIAVTYVEWGDQNSQVTVVPGG